MSGIKIINVLKDDSLSEILDLFRHTPADEVIFVLPKNAQIFRKEDHFAAFAAEATRGNKTISILSSTPAINALARKYEFTVMSASKAEAPVKLRKKSATLASQPLPADEDIQDTNTDAFESDVPVPGGEQDGIVRPQEEGDDNELPEGFHIEDETGTPSPAEDEEDAKEDAPVMTPIPTAPGYDYIEAMWRAKAAEQQQQGVARVVAAPQTKTSLWGRLFNRSPRRPSVPRHTSKRFTAGLLVASVGILGAAVYITTGSATIAVNPIAHPINEQIMVQVSDMYASIDSTSEKLPGQLISITKSVAHQETATGKREVASKARGTLTVHNAFSSSPQTLVATTRFLSPDGLVFRSLQSVTVPGSTVKNGEPVPGSITVDVIADRPGSQYNVGTGTFTIAAFKEKGDTDRATKIYGTSTIAMSGGANGPSTVVTQENYTAAKQSALAELSQQITQALKDQAQNMQVVDTTPVIGTPTLSAQIDDAADVVIASVSGTVTTSAFRPADLQQLIKDTILKKDRLTVFPDTLKIDIQDVQFHQETSVLSFTVSIQGNGYAPLDTASIVSDIKGKTSQEIRSYFANRDGVASATIRLSPFWVHRIPKQDSRVNLEIQYNN